MTDDERTLESFESEWSLLRPHHERGALFVVEPTLDPRAVARAIASDALEDVRRFLDGGGLRRPVPEEIERWTASPGEHRFRFYIVQPYVLAQPVVATVSA